MPIKLFTLWYCDSSDFRILQSMARDRKLVGLSLPSEKSCIVQALDDNHFMFLGALRRNITKVLQVPESFATSLVLKINMDK